MRQRSILLCALVLFVALLLQVGCNKSGDPTVPTYNPSGAAKQALELFDENKNGTLEAAELQNCPSLLAAMPRIDQDGNGKLTQDEIATRISVYKAQDVGLTSVRCQVFFNGQPVPDAKVTFVPEEFLKSAIQPATGTTDNTGWAGMKKEGLDYPGIQVGLYRVQISHLNPSGAETLPPQYNQKTTLGAEICPDIAGLERGLKFDLKP